MDEFTSVGVPLSPADQPEAEAPPAEPAAPPVPSPPAAPLTLLQQPSARHAAGVQLLWTSLALVGGAALGGPWGAVGAVLLTGGVRNLVRARAQWQGQAQPAEAGRSATIGVVGLGLGAYSFYNAFDNRRKDT